MKKSKPTYIHNFLKHIDSFVQEYKLFSHEQCLLVAVSGGVDSMAMLKSLIDLRNYGYSNHLRVIHINHASREGQDEEEKFVKDFVAAWTKVMNADRFDVK